LNMTRCLLASCSLALTIAVRTEGETAEGAYAEGSANYFPAALSVAHAHLPQMHTLPHMLPANFNNRPAVMSGHARVRGLSMQFPQFPEDLADDAWKSGLPTLEDSLATPMEEKVKLRTIINDWTSVAGTEADALRNHNDKAVHVMENTKSILAQMRDDVIEGIPDHVFALRPVGESAEDIQAMATVTSNILWDDWGRLASLAEDQGLVTGQDERIQVVNIDQIVSTPKARQGGVGAQLIDRIVKWAAGTGRLVTLAPANDELKEYYESLGFELIDTLGRSMVYSGSGLESSDAHNVMVDLKEATE